jgi:hypothetical protein
MKFINMPPTAQLSRYGHPKYKLIPDISLCKLRKALYHPNSLDHAFLDNSAATYSRAANKSCGSWPSLMVYY